MQLEKINKDPTRYSYIPIRKVSASIEDEDNNIPKFMEKEELAKFLQYTKSHGMYLDFAIFDLSLYRAENRGIMCIKRNGFKRR